jgi:hypothetical protein
MVREPSFAYTVVIPAYDAAAWISDAIRSTIDQEPAPAEIIVVDDGSHDETAAIAASFAGVHVVRRPNGGEAAARNTGLRAASTRWVSFLDADDTYLPYRQQRVVAHLAAHPEDAVVATDALIEEDGAFLYTNNSRPGTEFAHTDQRWNILDRNFIMSHVMCDRERLLALGGFDEALVHACDWDMWIRYVLDGGRIGFVDAPLSRYRRHPGSMTGSVVRVVRGDIAVWEKALTMPQLSSSERAHIEQRLTDAKCRLARHEMKDSLRTGEADVRRRAREVIRNSAQPWPARVKATAVMAAPRVLRSLEVARASAASSLARHRVPFRPER